jgi:hypothetical protein
MIPFLGDRGSLVQDLLGFKSQLFVIHNYNIKKPGRNRQVDGGGDGKEFGRLRRGGPLKPALGKSGQTPGFSTKLKKLFQNFSFETASIH